MPHVKFIAQKFGDKGVKDLERLGTALFVTLKNGLGQDIEPRASRICELKPHLSLEEAREALEAVDIMIGEAEEFTI